MGNVLCNDVGNIHFFSVTYICPTAFHHPVIIQRSEDNLVISIKNPEENNPLIWRAVFPHQYPWFR